MATTAQDHDDFNLNGNELPPPAYELTHAELDRKIADAAQRSLALSEQQQPNRPNLPPIDEDGFPIWSDELFEFNRQQREREVEEARDTKAQSEYNRPSAHHHYSAPSSSASGSSSPPPVHAQARPVNSSRRSLPPTVRGAASPDASKPKQDRLGWMDENAEGIAQDEDPHPPMTATQNGGRPPSSIRPSTQLQVQVGPRPHDVLAQPQSPVSDVEDDMPGAGLNLNRGLSRAPTYHPRGQAHPGHARAITERVSRRSTGSSAGGHSNNGSVDLPAWTAHAPSLEGPAYEEVMRTTTPANRTVSNPPPPPVPANPNSRRQSGVQNEWRPMQARPQAQERVAGVRHSTMGVPPPPAPAQPTWTTSPSTYTSPTVLPPVPAPVPAFAPAPAPPTFVAARPGTFDPGVAYRSTQSFTLTGRKDSLSGNGMAEAQRELHNAGAHAFYNHAIASTFGKPAAFKAPPPPPPRTGTVDDDVTSVMSGRSGGGRQSSVYSGGAGTRMSTYGAPPAGGIMGGGAALPAVGVTTYSQPQPGYQPGLGPQVSGAGGYQANVQYGVQPQWGGQPAGTGMGAYQPQLGEQSQPLATYQAQPAVYQPQSSAMHQSQPSATYQPQPAGIYQPQLSAGTYQPQQAYVQSGAPMQGGYVPGQAAPAQAAAGFVAPPPPPPKKFGGKLYKRL